MTGGGPCFSLVVLFSSFPLLCTFFSPSPFLFPTRAPPMSEPERDVSERHLFPAGKSSRPPLPLSPLAPPPLPGFGVPPWR